MSGKQFLSTLSLRRATWARGSRATYVEISIHALLAESDTIFSRIHQERQIISIHALLAESDGRIGFLIFPSSIFLSTLSLRRATTAYFFWAGGIEFLSTLSLRRATLFLQPYGLPPIFLSTLSLRRATSAHSTTSTPT